MKVLAVDLGATRLKAGLVDTEDGGVTGFTTAPTRDLSADEAIAALVATGRGLVEDDEVRRVGLCVPGIVDAGRVRALPGKFPGIVGRDLEAEVGGALGADVVTVTNDAVAYGAGEARHGAGAGHVRVVVVTIGTGVGVCVLENAAPVSSGPLGAGILSGQIPIGEPDSGPTDTNGVRGTIEARCAADALLHYAREAGGDLPDVPALYAAAERGEESALHAVDVYRTWLRRALVALTHAHTPSMIVLGGGPMAPGTPLLDRLEKEVNAELWPGCSVAIRPATLGDEASLLGVAELATHDRAAPR